MKIKIYAVAIYTPFQSGIALDFFFESETEFKALVQAAYQFFIDNEDAREEISKLTEKQELIDYFNNCDMEIACKELQP